MIYRATIKNEDWYEVVLVEAENIQGVEVKIKTEYPEHRITAITEDLAIAIL